MDAEQLQALVQIFSTGGGFAVLIAWIQSLRDDIKYWRQQTEDAQDKLEKALQTHIEWQRYEQMKNLPRDDTRPIPPRWDATHPAARIED